MSNKDYQFNITDMRVVRYTPKNENSPVRGFADIVINNCFVIKGLRVMEGKIRRYVAMPFKPFTRDNRVNYVDVCHPIVPEVRTYIENEVLRVYDSLPKEQ